MFWTRLSLSWKLFFAVVVPVLFAVLLMAGAVGYSMRAGFSQYLLDAELAQFTELAKALEQDPQAAQGWPALADRKAWHDLVEIHVMPPAIFAQPARAFDAGGPPLAPPRLEERPAHPLLPPEDAAPNSAPDAARDQPMNPQADLRPPRSPGQRPMSVARPLPDRLTLLDADGTVLAGPTLPGDATYAERPLVDADGAQIATLRLNGLLTVPAPADRAFLAAQFRAIAVAAAIALPLASLVAWLTAQQFLAPIRAIGQHVAQLAVGDLSSRLSAPHPGKQTDELGRMMHDHNTLAERLAAVRQREKQWISDTSHELKTPLSVLRAQIEALQDGIRPTTPQALDSMHNAVMRLSRLTDDLSLLSRSDEGRLPLTATPLDVCALLQDAAEDARARAEAAGLRLDSLALIGSAPLIVRADPIRLRQVFDNLLENACRYTDAPGRIRLSCHGTDTLAEITVADTAPCPPPSALPRLFDRFRRGETSRARSHGGSGLGLSICRALIEAQGGQIIADPSDLGGLCIRIQFPLAEV